MDILERQQQQQQQQQRRMAWVSLLIANTLQMKTNKRMVTNYGNLGANGEKKINKGIISELDFICFLRIQRVKTDLTELKLSNKL